ncbi:MAG: YraN family protein [Candidatus Omnitrophica bacterium]|nr:YraN family protein [Candidatus Omnitrophota bacterium]
MNNKGAMGDRTNKTIGRLGEAVAGKYLISKGYVVLDRNFTTPFGEIDLITQQNDMTVFFEVKTRTSDRFGSPLLGITAAKQKSMIKNSLYYLKINGLCETPSRIDVIAVNLDESGRLKMLEHVRNALEIEDW